MNSRESDLLPGLREQLVAAAERVAHRQQIKEHAFKSMVGATVLGLCALLAAVTDSSKDPSINCVGLSADVLDLEAGIVQVEPILQVNGSAGNLDLHAMHYSFYEEQVPFEVEVREDGSAQAVVHTYPAEEQIGVQVIEAFPVYSRAEDPDSLIGGTACRTQVVFPEAA